MHLKNHMFVHKYVCNVDVKNVNLKWQCTRPFSLKLNLSGLIGVCEDYLYNLSTDQCCK